MWALVFSVTKRTAQTQRKGTGMKQQTQLIEAVLQAGEDRHAAILQAAIGTDKPRMGTAKDAAAILGACVRTVERYARQGAFPRVHLSPRKVRYDLTAVERFACEGRNLPAA